MRNSTIELGINIDHVATVRQARRVSYRSVQRAPFVPISNLGGCMQVRAVEEGKHRRSLAHPSRRPLCGLLRMRAVGLSSFAHPSS
jgi:hypothetical protein